MDQAIQANRILNQLPVNTGPGPSAGSNSADTGTEQAVRTLLVVDTRVRDRECLAGSIAARRADMDVAAFASFAEWNRDRDLHPPLAAVLLNIGGSSLNDQNVAADVKRLVAECAPAPVIAMADSDDLREIFQALDCGVRGYIPATMGIAVCIEAISLVLAGGLFVPASSVLATQHMLTTNDQAAKRQASIFTSRQAEVVEALRRGKANKIIAYELNMCESTVKVHVRNVMRKLKATNRTEVVNKINEMLQQDVASLS